MCTAEKPKIGAFLWLGKWNTTYSLLKSDVGAARGWFLMAN
jgi:hypothetical protein